MVLAVHMPPHVPLPGMARRSISQKSCSLILPALNWSTASNTLTMLSCWPLYSPGRMVRPQMQTAGTFELSMPIKLPGIFLSRPPITITPSIHWPPTQVSTQLAITSRETSEYFMLSVPMAMPSEMVGVPEISGLAPASLRACTAASASRCRPDLQSVMVE